MSPIESRQHPADSHPDPTPGARGTLQRTVLDLLHASGTHTGQHAGAEHWPSDGPASESAESRERLARTGERRVWRAQDAAQSVLAHDVGVYARALRDTGLGPRQVVAAVVTLVREAAAPAMTGAPLDRMMHDAGRYCVAAYFAR